MSARASSVRITRGIVHTLFYLALIAWGFAAAMPMLWMVVSAFKITRDIFVWPPSFLPKNPTVENFVAAWTIVPFARFLINSAVISTVQILAVLSTGSMVGYALSIRRFPGRTFVWVMVLAGLIIPEQVTYIPRFMLIKGLGWVNTYAGIVSPYLTSCFGIFLLAQFFLSIPVDLIDAARIDGLHEFGILFRIVIPLSKPALATLSIFTWLGSWNNFFWPLLVVVSAPMRTIPVGLVSFYQEEGIANFGHVLAGNTMAIVAPLIVFLAFQQYFIQGIGVTGLKGI